MNGATPALIHEIRVDAIAMAARIVRAEPDAAPRPIPPHPAEPTSLLCFGGFQSGWCSSTLDEDGDAYVQECWDVRIWVRRSLVAVDLDLDECYCQDECPCLDLGHGMEYYVATRDNVIASCQDVWRLLDVYAEKMYKGSCAGFRGGQGQVGRLDAAGVRGIACSKDQCCAARKQCC